MVKKDNIAAYECTYSWFSRQMIKIIIIIYIIKKIEEDRIIL